MDLSVVINQYPVELGLALDTSHMEAARIKKAGFFIEHALPVPRAPGDVIYWAKNCTFSCFDGTLCEAANFDMSAGADMMYGTTAYLFFNQKSLRYLIFAVIWSDIAASSFTENFRDAATRRLGRAEEKSPLCHIWKGGNEILVSELSATGNKAFLHWQYTGAFSHWDALLDALWPSPA